MIPTAEYNRHGGYDFSLTKLLLAYAAVTLALALLACSPKHHAEPAEVGGWAAVLTTGDRVSAEHARNLLRHRGFETYFAKDFLAVISARPSEAAAASAFLIRCHKAAPVFSGEVGREKRKLEFGPAIHWTPILESGMPVADVAARSACEGEWIKWAEGHRDSSWKLVGLSYRRRPYKDRRGGVSIAYEVIGRLERGNVSYGVMSLFAEKGGDVFPLGGYRLP